MACGDGLRKIGLRKAVQSGQGCDLVTFRQGRIVEDVIDEIIQLATVSHHRLADVNELRCALADAVNAKELPAVRMKQELKHSDGIADELAARDLSIAGDADFVRNPRLRQFFFVATDK